MFFVCGLVPDLKYVRVARRRFDFQCMVLILGAGFVLTAQARQDIPLTLAEAEDIAVANEPGRMALIARAEALEEQAVAAGQLPDPTLRVGLANFPISGGGFSTEGMTQAQLGFRQEFPRGRSRSLNTDRLQSMATQFSRNAEARSRDVLMATRTDWLESYYWQRAQQIVSESRPFFADLVNITRSMYAVGRKSQHDVLSADLELSRLDDRLIEANHATAEARAELSRWLGSDAYRPVALKLPAWPPPPSLHDLQQSLDEHPHLGAADADISTRQTGVDLARESYKTDWTLDLGYGYRDGRLPSGEPRSDFVSISVSVGLPIFNENRQDRNLASALKERRAAVANKDEVRAELRSRLQERYARWSELSSRLALYENQILDQSTGRAQAALLAYQSDAGDFSDVMRAYIDDLNTRLEHIRLQVERAQVYAALANLGGIPR